MTKYFKTIYILSFLAVVSCSQKPEKESKTKKPNIIYILADDLGYGEIGIYGQEKIETPNIDKLGQEGMIFTQHYSGSAVCAPARSVFLTGLHSGNTPIRGNHEWGSRGDTWNFELASQNPDLEGQYPLPDTTITLAENLQNSGYVTGMVGKWGLGAPNSHSIPNKMGFDFFYGYNCQRQAHTYYPPHLYKNEEKVKLNNKLVVPGTKLKPEADSLDIAAYADYTLNEYSADLMHEEALNFIEKNKDQSFFLYYASPIPHVALQAKQKWVDYYVHKFGDEAPYTGQNGYFPHRYPHAAYAAMISTLDEQVGEIMAKLKELGLDDNTLVIFTSDNGPSYAGGADPTFFNSAQPFKGEYGWAKGFLKEGGIRVPFIANWPDKIKPGTTSEVISSFQDMMPTFTEISGDKHSGYTDGKSLLPAFGGDQKQVHSYLYWEFPSYGGQQAVRFGKWKGYRFNINNKNKEMEFELYDLSNDIQELTDVSEKYPKIADSVLNIMRKEHTVSPLDRFLLHKIDSAIN